MADQKNDYMNYLNRIRRKRNNKNNWNIVGLALLACLLFVIIVFAGVRLRRGPASEADLKGNLAADENLQTPSVAEEQEEETAELEKDNQKEDSDRKKQVVVDSYKNLGIVQVTGYLNVRKEPGKNADVIGKLLGDSACEILEQVDESWYKISSGGLEGYIHSEFVLSGEEARKKAFDLVELRAIIKADKLNIRKEPGTDSDIEGQVYCNERYDIQEEIDGWIKISSGFLSSEFVEIDYALNEARKLDLKSMVFNLYDNLGISNVDNYLNVRQEPSENSKIIAKMPSKAAGDILENTGDGWYKIKSGNITGYVKSDYILTGPAAKDEALLVAQLMAIVNTDMLNARTEPNTESKIWTQISNNERYAVLNQMDGWVEIELEEDSNAYVATDFVDVRYALPQAIKFSPLEEKANASASLRTQIVNYSLQFLGNPYVWGGTSLTRGADCSGFTLSVYAKFGIALPHYSGSQANMGKAVSSSEMRPGDLVFYANSKGTINHVGIYIGNGQIVNAASRRSGIKISAWNYRKPVKIRNILGD